MASERLGQPWRKSAHRIAEPGDIVLLLTINHVSFGTVNTGAGSRVFVGAATTSLLRAPLSMQGCCAQTSDDSPRLLLAETTEKN